MNTMTATDFASLFALNGNGYPAGLTGRVIRGTKPEDFATLTDDPTRKLVMLMGPDGLTKLPGKSGYEIMMAIGYEPDYLKHKVAQGNQFKIVVFPESTTAALATWDRMLDIVKLTYPAVADKLEAQREALKTTKFEAIEASAGFKFLDVEKAGPSDSRYMTYERFQASAGTLADVRAFLYFSVHLRELYSGDGYTYDAMGNRGLMEYITPNCPIADLPGAMLIDLEVKLPEKVILPPLNLSGISANRLPLPGFYSRNNIGNPLYQPNPQAIQAEAYAMAAQYGVKRASQDKLRVFRLHVDQEPDFGFPLTAVDPRTGAVRRYLWAGMKGVVPVPAYWSEDNNQIIWVDDPKVMINAINGEPSIMGGRLSVGGAWNDSERALEWDMANAAAITTMGFTIDFHAMTSRFDMQNWRSVRDSQFGPKGVQPRLFMEGNTPDKMFPVITPQNCWHPEYNPDGLWRTIIAKEVDEVWAYVNKLGYVVLWTGHCNRFTFGATLDPSFYAVAVYHNFLRGMLEAEPFWLPKGMTSRSEFFGVYAPEVEYSDDENAQKNYGMLQLFDGFPDLEIPPYDLVITSGQAGSHCVLRTMQQAVRHMQETGRADSVQKIVYLKDTASVIPGFEEATEKAYAELEAAGVRMETTATFQLV